MTDFQDFPDRPTHEDFWKLSEIILQQDGYMEDDTDLPTIVSRVVDFESLMYLATQRSYRLSVNPDLTPVLAAMFLDGFMAGVTYGQRYKGE